MIKPYARASADDSRRDSHSPLDGREYSVGTGGVPVKLGLSDSLNSIASNFQSFIIGEAPMHVPP